jgi:structural maintenance of chromosome 1
LARNGVDGSQTANEDGDEDEGDEGEGAAKKAWIMAIFLDNDKKNGLSNGRRFLLFTTKSAFLNF